jgi:hypothetical protein
MALMGCGRKLLWPVLRYCRIVYLEGLRKSAKNLRMVGLQTEI